MSTRGLYYRACAGEQNRRGLDPRCGRRDTSSTPPRTWGNPLTMRAMVAPDSPPTATTSSRTARRPVDVPQAVPGEAIRQPVCDGDKTCPRNASRAVARENSDLRCLLWGYVVDEGRPSVEAWPGLVAPWPLLAGGRCGRWAGGSMRAWCAAGRRGEAAASTSWTSPASRRSSRQGRAPQYASASCACPLRYPATTCALAFSRCIGAGNAATTFAREVVSWSYGHQVQEAEALPVPRQLCVVRGRGQRLPAPPQGPPQALPPGSRFLLYPPPANLLAEPTGGRRLCGQAALPLRRAGP